MLMRDSGILCQYNHEYIVHVISSEVILGFTDESGKRAEVSQSTAGVKSEGNDGVGLMCLPDSSVKESQSVFRRETESVCLAVGGDKFTRVVRVVDQVKGFTVKGHGGDDLRSWRLRVRNGRRRRWKHRVESVHGRQESC